MIDLSLLQNALAIAEAGSFASAAKSLGIAQPTLSRQISALELALGVRLFDRGRRGAVPTPLGQEILARAAELVQDANLLSHEIDLLRGANIGTLRVGCGVYPGHISVGRAMGRLAAQYPGLGISVVVNDWRHLANEVREAKLDLAVAELGEHTRHPDLEVEALPEHQGAFVCRAGHPLTELRAPTLADIFRFPFAGTRLAPRVGALLEGKATAGQVDPATGEYIPSIEVNTLRMAAEAVAESDAFGIFPLPVVGALMQAGRLHVLPLQPAWLKTGYGFITLRNRTLSPAAVAFMQEVRAVESELAAEEQRARQSSRPRHGRTATAPTAPAPANRRHRP